MHEYVNCNIVKNEKWQNHFYLALFLIFIHNVPRMLTANINDHLELCTSRGIIIACQRMREGNIFTSMCHSVHGGGVGISGPMSFLGGVSLVPGPF